jgi:hypothetical protein
MAMAVALMTVRRSRLAAAMTVLGAALDRAPIASIIAVLIVVV